MSARFTMVPLVTTNITDNSKRLTKTQWKRQIKEHGCLIAIFYMEIIVCPKLNIIFKSHVAINSRAKECSKTQGYPCTPESVQQIKKNKTSDLVLCHR